MEKEKLEFPMTFDTCPGVQADGSPCGSKKRLVETAMAETQAVKNPNQRSALHIFGVALTDPVSALSRVTVPVLMVLVDACADCGCLYITRVEKTTGMPQMQGKQPPPFGIPKGFG